MFRTGKPSVLKDVREVSDFPWKAHLLANGIVTVLVVPLHIGGKIEGVIGVRFAEKRVLQTEEIELALSMGNQAMLAMEMNRLSKLNHQAVIAAERNRMAREIHDTLAQGFTGVIMQLEAAKGASVRNDTQQVAAHLDKASNLARQSLGEARRSVRALRPKSLRDGNLCSALEDLLKRMTDDIEMQAEFRLEGETRVLPPEWEDELLRIAQESLTNSIKHSRARHFRLSLSFEDGPVQLQLTDDGLGFDLQSEHEGYGLIGMKERVDRMNGQFIIRSKRDQGTEILVILNSKLSESNEA
jgi:signal transduction histidine kinase